ncbi:unnamed protein product, partial [Sphacelaria rigidula]
AFSPEHVRNLADAAGSPTLEVGLRTAAAEQLRGVLVAPGVARAILQNDLDAEGGERILWLNIILRSMRFNAPHAASLYGNNDQGMSSLSSRVLRAACSFLLPKSALPTPWTSSAGTANNKNSEEVFLGLLWTAVWKFPPVRLTLAKGGGSGNRIDSEEVGRCVVGYSMFWGITGEMVATAVLRRLFDTRPAVRRLASRIAVRVAFDAPTFFSVFAPSPSPLSSVAVRYGTPPSTCPTCRINHPRVSVSSPGTMMLLLLLLPPLPGHPSPLLDAGAGTELCAAIAVPKQTENTDRYDVVLRLAAGEWKKKKVVVSCTSTFFHSLFCVYLFEQAASRAGEGVLRAEDVADCVSRELMGASRRSEFGSAMRKARAWMLAGPAYLKAFFGKSEAWQNAFRRFLETPPKSVNDRIVLREVMELLRTGVRYMCPRGLMILADATEVCLTPTLSDTWIPSDGGAGEVFGDWRPATFRKDSPRELEVKEALRLSVLELLVAVVASSSPPPPSSAASPCTDLHRKTTTALARSSLVPVLCDEFMAGENEFGGAPRRSDDGIGGNGERSPRARRLAIEFVAGLVRRCGPEVTRIWSGVSQQGPAVGKQARENRRTLTMGEGLEFDEQTGEARFWTSSVLAHMIQ